MLKVTIFRISLTRKTLNASFHNVAAKSYCLWSI